MALINSDVIPAGVTGPYYDYTIDQSLRFNDDDSAYLSRTPSSASNQKTFTLSCWFKPSKTTLNSLFCGARTGASGTYSLILFSASDNRIRIVDNQTSYPTLETSGKFRDTSAWYHLVVAVDTTQATASNRAKIYINGEETSYAASNYWSQNANTNINTTATQLIGQQASGSYLDGYLAEYHFIDGQALDPTYFGETGTYGDWKPIEYTGSYGTNGYYLDFAGTYYNDKSGNGNNWTANNLASTDVVLDSPTNNFATLNPLINAYVANFYEGNLKADNTTYCITAGTLQVTSGKWYYEVECNGIYAGYPSIGVYGTSFVSGGSVGGVSSSDGGLTWNSGSGYIQNGSYDTTVTPSWSSGDILGLAIDLDSGTKTAKFYINNSLQATTTITGDYFTPSIGGRTSSAIATVNFGQDSSFAGRKTAQGNTDDNNIGDFYYTPPSGYLALCTANLSDPAVIPSEHFSTSLWTGNGTSQSITGVGFQPDLVWHKARNDTHWHGWVDAVRGNTKYIWSNTTSSEYTDSTRVTSFDSDGFSLGSQDNVNENTINFVSWNWKANGSGSSNTNGDITSTVSANQDAGFSIVKWTANGTATATVGHGLSSAPEIYIEKKISTTGDWFVFTDVIDGSWDYLKLNFTDTKTDYSTAGSTATTFVSTSASTDGYITYCFHSVDGFSKVGSYTGNGSTDGTFVYTGFRPAFVLIKRTDSTVAWIVHDTARNTYNVSNLVLQPNVSTAEVTAVDIDIISNGFKCRTTDQAANASGGTYIYIAFAETPFSVGGGIAR